MKPFKIHNVLVDPPVVLAPMEGVTDRAFRTLVRGLGGCGLAVTEFVSSEALTREIEAAWRMAELDPSEHPVSIQIYGRDPERMAQAARHCEALGADIVDINLGCPSKRVTTGCAGSALMREPELATEIFRAVRGAISVPMTVKMRLGWDDSSLNAPEIARAAVGEGASMITVHGRTKTQAYKGHARWSEIARVREAVDVPLLVNGDIIDSTTARMALEQSGADGIMVGRGVMADPWTMARITADFRGEVFEEPSLQMRREVLVAYLHKLETFDLPMLIRLKKVISYFSKGLPNAARLRSDVQRAQSLQEAQSILNRFFDAIEQREPWTPQADIRS